MSFPLLAEMLLLLLACNGAPIILCRLLGERFDAPLDGGLRSADGRRLFGPAKTWRGALAAVLTGAGLAYLFGLGVVFGALFGAAVIAGDLVSSYVKRRLGIAPSGRASGLDQLPEALLPVLIAYLITPLTLAAALLAALLFTFLGVTLSPFLYRIGLRSRPY